ncbi:MAG TPA: recombinase family protein, partial [Terracidiphilus sp.]
MIQRCAAYARYSSDLQSPRSIEDQLRICREYARAHGFVFLEEHVYTDEALSGVGADRPGLGRMLDAALSPARPFDVILLDDSSRLARNTKDALGIFQLCRSRHSWKTPIAFRPRSISSPISSRYGSQALTDGFAAGPDAASPFKKPVVTPMA